MSDFIKITLKPGKDEAVRRFHPWIFSGAINKIHGNIAEGDVVEVYSNHDEYWFYIEFLTVSIYLFSASLKSGYFYGISREFFRVGIRDSNEKYQTR